MRQTESEENLIERVVKTLGPRAGARGEGLLLGPGDDGAILRGRHGFECVISCDTFQEGVHFLVRTHPAESVGYKALARAASDLAAMGATPRVFLLNLTISRERKGKWLDKLLAGMARAARELGMELAGGDTTRGGKVSLGMTVLGEVARGRGLTRSGARPGDLIYVSGRLGEARLGLEMVLKGVARGRRFSEVVARHLYPRIPVQLGTWLSRAGAATAAIDISDGLSTDLGRLVRASGVGARIFADRIPAVGVPEAVRGRLRGVKIDPLEMALNGGDDYQLSFTVPAARVGRLRSAPGFRDLKCIGETTRERRFVLIDRLGKSKVLESGGWDPFRV